MKNTKQLLEIDGRSAWIVDAIIRILQPLARMVIGKVSYKAMAEILKRVYLYEASQYLKRKKPNQPVTNAALAALSGLDSRAIKALESQGPGQYTDADLCVEANILEMWATNALFQDADGRPAELNIHGSGRTFQGLVWRAAGRAVTPQTVLDELLRNSNVEIDKETSRVRLLSETYQNISASEKTVIDAGSLAMHRLGLSVFHNLCRVEDESMDPWLQQDRWSIKIPPEDVPRVRTEIRDRLRAGIQDVKEVLDKNERSTAPQAGDYVLGVGWYYWER